MKNIITLLFIVAGLNAQVSQDSSTKDLTPSKDQKIQSEKCIQEAYVLLNNADHDYIGHRVNALNRLRGFCINHQITVDDFSKRVDGLSLDDSDAQIKKALEDMQQAGQFFNPVSFGNLGAAIKETQAALEISSKMNEISEKVGPLLNETYKDLSRASNYYGAHKYRAMKCVEKIANELKVTLPQVYKETNGKAYSDSLLKESQSNLKKIEEILPPGEHFIFNLINEANAQIDMSLSLK
jgi:hypothetical protein